jgi:hypothetical protein
MVTAPALSVETEPGRFVRWLRGRPAWQTVILGMLADLAGRVLIVWLLVGLFGIKPDRGKDAPTPTEVLDDPWLLVLVLIGAPLLETLIFQVGMQKGLGCLRVFRNRPGVLIVLTAITFASQHFYSPFYVAMVLPAGLLFAAMFYALGAGWRAFWIVVVAHAGMNAWVTAMGLLH